MRGHRLHELKVDSTLPVAIMDLEEKSSCPVLDGLWEDNVFPY